MNDTPDDTPDGSDSDRPNPFRGTPFEQFFAGGVGGLGGAMGGPGGIPDLSALFGQIQSMMQPHDGPLNWDVAADLAPKSAAQLPHPSPTPNSQLQSPIYPLAPHPLTPPHAPSPVRRPHQPYPPSRRPSPHRLRTP